MAGVFRFRDFELSETLLELRRAETRVDLRPKALLLLLHLVRNRHRVVSRNELLSELWHDVVVSGASLTNALYEVRRALGDERAADQCIATLRGRGYRFAAQVVEGDGADPDDTALAGVLEPQAEPATPFVDREREMAQLHAALAASRSGAGRIVLLQGPPGIGKTRTALELIRTASGMGIEAHLGRAYPGDGAPPLWPWIQVLRALVETRGSTECRVDAGPEAVQLARLVPALGGVAPLAEPKFASGKERWALFDAVVSFLARNSRRRPLLIALDDLHDADETSLELLRFVSRRLHEMPLLIVGTHREPAQGSAIERVLLQTLREPGVQSLDLAGLQHDAVSEILERRLGAPASDALLDRVFTATGGNPFFVAEVARLLAQRGTVPDGAPSSFPIPQSLRDTVRSRLAEAPAKAQELLAVAAVAGPRVHLTLLRRVLAFASEALLEALDTCQTLDLLRQVGPGRYEFIHGFVRETLYEALPRGRRALLHRDVGDALEVLSVATPGSNLAEIAHHFSEAAGLDRALPAIRYARRAAQRALSVSAPLEALAQLRRALATLEFLTEPDPELHAELHVELCEALCAIDAPALEVGRECDEAARLAQLCQRWDLYARAVGGNAYYQISKNMIALLDPDRSPTRRVTLGRLEEALERLGEAHPELRVGLLFAYGSLLEREGPPERAMAVSDEMLLLADRLGDPGLRSRAIAQRCYMRPDLERIERRVEAARLSAELGRAAGDPSMEVFAHTLRASLELQRGDRAEAEAAAQHILSSESDARISTVRPVACFWRCLSAQLDGRLADAHHWSLAGIQRGVELNFSDEFRSAVLAAQQWWLQQLEGNTAQLVAPWEAYLAEHPDMLSARIPLARLYSESGQLTEARAALEGLGPEPLATLPRDDNWLFFGAVAADVCADVGDTGRAAYFLELLEPYAGRVATAGWVLSTVGAVARPLARLHAALGRHDDAEEYFERALALHHQLSSPPLVAWTQLDRARSLVQRGRRSDTARIRQLCAAAVETVRPLDLPALVARAKSIA